MTSGSNSDVWPEKPRPSPMAEGSADGTAGIGRLDEVREKIEEGSLPLFPIDAAHLLGAAAEPLRRLAQLADATPSDLVRARKPREAALAAIAPAAALCDIVTAARLAGEPLPVDVSRWEDVRDRHRLRRRHSWGRVPEPSPRLPTA